MDVANRQSLSLSDEQINLLKKLMKRFISDVKEGVTISDAGWIVNEGRYDRKLMCGIIERKQGMLRISPRKDLLLALHKSDKETKWLAGLCLDMLKVNEVRKIIFELVKKLEENVRFKWIVVAIGLSQMLKELSTHVTTELVFNAGLSAIDWHKEISTASTQLALQLVSTWCDIKPEELNKLGESLNNNFSYKIPYTQGESDNVEKIKRALKWDKVAQSLNKEEEVITALGILWFIDLCLTSKGIEYPESISVVNEDTWKLLISKTVRLRSEREIAKRIKEICNKLRRIVEGVCWEGVICLPWG